MPKIRKKAIRVTIRKYNNERKRRPKRKARWEYNGKKIKIMLCNIFIDDKKMEKNLYFAAEKWINRPFFHTD